MMMTTLKERAADLKDQIDALQQAKRGETQTSVLATQDKVLKNYAEVLFEATRKVELLHGAGIAINLNASLCHAQKTIWSQLRDKQNHDDRYLREAEGIAARQNTRHPFEALAKQLNQACSDAWQDYTRTQIPQIDGFLLTILEKDGVHAATARDVSQLLTRLRSIASGFPADQNRIQAFRDQSHRARSQWQQIIGEGLPPTVKTFFAKMAAQNGRVPLSLLTPEVQQWIEERNIIDGFSIVAS